MLYVSHCQRTAILYQIPDQLTQRQLRLGRRPSCGCHDIVRRNLCDDLRQGLNETEGFLEACGGIGEVGELLGQGLLCFWLFLLLLLWLLLWLGRGFGGHFIKINSSRDNETETRL